MEPYKDRNGALMHAMTLLVADDDPVVRRLLEHRLTSAGYTVTMAASGVEAARLLDQSRFDVLITDMVMPGGIDGIELLHLAKQQWADMEVIVITAQATIDTAVEAMKKGAADYLEKPINFEELFVRLEKIAEVKSLVKNAGDLREAMDVTESSAAETIQRLECANSAQEALLESLETLLDDQGLDAANRIAKAVQLLKERHLAVLS